MRRLLLPCLFLAAAVVTFVCLPWRQNADDLLTTLMSIQHLTLYFWEQDRFGNLLPALTCWIRDPTTNAETQIALRIASGLIAPVFFTAAIFPRATDAWWAALLTDCAVLLSVPPVLLHEVFTGASPYSPSLACAGLAVLASRGRHWRGARAFACVAGFLTANVVNIALPMVALPTLATAAVAAPSEERTRTLIVFVGTACVAAMLPHLFAPSFATPMGVAFSWRAVHAMADSVWPATGGPAVVAFTLPIATAAIVYRTRMPRLFAAMVLVWPFCAVAAFALIASSDHVMRNQFHPRYALPVLMMAMALGGAGAWLCVRRFPSWTTNRTAIVAAAVVVMVAGAGHRLAAFGTEQDLIGDGKAAVARTVAARYVSLGLDAIVGDFWDVWPSVLQTEQMHRDGGWLGPDVLGIAHRSAMRRSVFLSRLADKGHLRLVCIDLTDMACVAFAARVFAVPGLRGQPFAPSEAIAGPHMLAYIDIQPP